MNFKDIRTFEAFLKEYGMDSGKSSYGSNKSVMAPSSSPSNKTSSSPTTKKASPSPTTAGPAKNNQPEILAVRATDVPADAVVKSIKNEPMGKVVSRVGDKPKADALVVDTGKMGKQKYQVLPKDQKVFIDNPEYQEESKATKLLSKLKIKSKKVRSIKKILRNSKFNDQQEIIFEINFNDPKLAKGALAAPISCGFEAETTWPSLDAGGNEDDGLLDDLGWSEIEDLIYDQEGSRSVRQVEEAFREWLGNTDYFYDAESNVIGDMVDERKRDMAYITEYAYQELGADEVEDYKNETLDGLDDDEKDGYADWDEDQWAKELIDEKYADEFEEWLADQIRDNSEHWDDAWEKVLEQYEVSDWVNSEYDGDWYRMLADLSIYLENPNADGGVAAVAAELEPWAESNSQSSDVRSGDYHSGKSVDNTYWRVEEDSSIQADGAGAEIISPVYATPQVMMSEMKSLFEFFKAKDVETNESTGLHVTMSWNGEQTAVNKLKMAVLLGDKYLLSLFDRENNTYTQSQFDRVKQGVSELMKNPSNLKTLAAVEEILGSQVSENKFSSINFKEATNSAGNQLIEFRIGGGDDYHTKLDSVLKSVVRYAAIMQAGHDTNAFRKDYILALYRLIRKESDVDIEKIKSMNIAYGDAGKNPILAALQSSSHKASISSVTDYLTKGLELIAKSKELQRQTAQGDLFTPTESVNEDDAFNAGEAARMYDQGKNNIMVALAITAIDIGVGIAKAPRATSIAAIRKGVKDLGFTADSLWQGILSNPAVSAAVIEIALERKLDKYELQAALSKGLSAMLKTNLSSQPEQPKSIVKFKQGDVIYVKDSDIDLIQRGKATPEMFLVVSPPEQETNDAFIAKFGFSRWDTTKLTQNELKKITADLGIKFMKESVFDRFDQLTLEEQLKILERVDSTKLNEAWSRKTSVTEGDMIGRKLLRRGAYKAAVDALAGVLARKMPTKKHSIEYYAARVAQSYPGVDARELTDMYNNLVNETGELSENLRKWFKDKWVRFGPDGKIKGDCARGSDSEGKPKCLPQSKAHSLGKKGRASAAARKRREDPNPERKGAAKNVATKKESVVGYTDIPFNTCPSCGGDIVHESQLNEKQDACYHKVKARYKVWPSAYASGALVQCRKKGAKNWGKKKNESSVTKGSMNEAAYESGLQDNDQRVVIGVYGAKSKEFRKKFRNQAAQDQFFDHPNREGNFEIHRVQKADISEGAVPDNRKVRILNNIMSKPLLANDIGSQMAAFFAIPDPLMVNEFRKQRAIAGDDVDLRPIVKGFINSVVHPELQKQINISESVINEYDDLGKEKQTIIKTISGLDATDKAQAVVLDRIYKILNSGQISTNIDVAFSKPLVDENLPEAEKIKIRKDMTKIIAGLEQDYGSMNKFITRLERDGGVVNVTELAKTLNTFDKVFGDEVTTAAFITLANYGVGKKQKGPGEYALACLSNQIKLAEGEGDLQINGIGKVELKAALSSAGGRIGYGGGSQKSKRAVIDKYAQYLPTVLARLNAGGGGSISIRPFIDALNTDLPTNNPNNVKVRKALMSELLTMDLEKFAAPVIDKFATSMNFDEIETEYLIQNFAWYKDRDDFDALLLIHVPNRKTAMIRNAEDLIAFRNSGHANATSISIVPTQAGAGREQWAQLTLNKAKAG